MSILKRGSYNNDAIKKVSFTNMQLELESQQSVDSLKFDKEEYENILNSAKEDGFKNGYEDGFGKGFLEGKTKFEEEKRQLYENLEHDRNALCDFLESESVLYVNNVNSEIKNLITSSISKIFFDAVSNDDIMIVYSSELLDYLSKKYKLFSVVVNNNTFLKLKTLLKDISYDIDDSLDDFDFIIKSKSQTEEFFLNDKFEKIKSLFK
ncbi:hypothetical protein ACV3V0_10660 [Clostridium perfringens]